MAALGCRHCVRRSGGGHEGVGRNYAANKRRFRQSADNNLKAAKKIRELREWLTKEESRHLIEEANGSVEDRRRKRPVPDEEPHEGAE